MISEVWSWPCKLFVNFFFSKPLSTKYLLSLHWMQQGNEQVIRNLLNIPSAINWQNIKIGLDGLTEIPWQLRLSVFADSSLLNLSDDINQFTTAFVCSSPTTNTEIPFLSTCSGFSNIKRRMYFLCKYMQLLVVCLHFFYLKRVNLSLLTRRIA